MNTTESKPRETPRRGRPSARARILEAAGELVRELGAGSVSLDAVALRAGVSKGGLLYHFPTKVDLLRALVALHVEQVESEIAEAEQRNAGKAALIRAVIEADCRKEPAMSDPCGILAAIAEDPQLIDPIRAHVQRLVDRLRRTGDADRALIAFLALEGLRMHELFELGAFDAQERQRITARLMEFVEEG